MATIGHALPLALFALVFGQECKLLKKKAPELPASLTVASVGVGTGEMRGKVRFDESHSPYDAKLLADGVEVKYEVNGMWAPLPPAKRKPGKHTLTLELVKDGKTILTQPAEITVVAERPELTLVPVRKKGTTLYCGGCKPEYVEADENFEVSFELRTPAGNTVEWDGQKTTSTGAPQTVSYRFASRLADADIADLLDFYKGVRLPVKVTSPEGGVAEYANLKGTDALRMVGNRLAKGPVDMGDKGSGPGTDRNVLIVSELSGVKSKVVGAPATKVRDVDLVAVFSENVVSRLSCGTYSNKAGTKTGTYTLVVSDLDVAVYDRRSARLKGKRTFKATGGSTCPTVISTSSASFSSGDSVAAEKFVASFVKR